MKFIVVLMLLLSAKAVAPTFFEKPCVQDTFVPANERESYVYLLYMHGQGICRAHGIDPLLMLTQAVAEQGWTMTKGYRVFNIAGQGVRVFDSQAGEWRNHRIYPTIEHAIRDYCVLLNKYGINGQDVDEQFRIVGTSRYSESPKYLVYLLSVRKSVESIYCKFADQ